MPRSRERGERHAAVAGHGGDGAALLVDRIGTGPRVQGALVGRIGHGAGFGDQGATRDTAKPGVEDRVGGEAILAGQYFGGDDERARHRGGGQAAGEAEAEQGGGTLVGQARGGGGGPARAGPAGEHQAQRVGDARFGLQAGDYA